MGGLTSAQAARSATRPPGPYCRSGDVTGIEEVRVAVGSTVGVALGSTVGMAVSSTVGVAVGSTVSVAVGSIGDDLADTGVSITKAAG